MKWIKFDESKTIEDVILRNTKYDNINNFVNGSKTTYQIKGLEEAALIIKNAIKNKIPITIVGDYDADGVNSSSIMDVSIKELGGIVKVRLPKRFSEGYGLSTKIVDEIDEGLIITVDNGIVAFDAVEQAKAKGLTVIITDHHLPDDSGKLPDADIIINPHIKGTADFEDYCGAGIAYKLAQKLIDNPKTLKKLSCFAAIGTICDVMPLIEENRLIVIEGLRNLVTYGCRTSGMYSLLKANDLDRHITAENIGYKIGPIINAAGRLKDDGAYDAYKVVSYDGPFDETLGLELVELNETRKKIVADSMAKIRSNIQSNCLFGEFPLVVYEPKLNEGIVGILAGRFGNPNFYIYRFRS
jgi:single-stranded-DNA-specific exonuclease